ncbi:hypothetical protein GmHk_11G032611 [Glycine max]|nr:hypothetical protein GmHk_11G032611 [Glycine max]
MGRGEAILHPQNLPQAFQDVGAQGNDEFGSPRPPFLCFSFHLLCFYASLQVALHSMLLSLWLDKFANSLCKKYPDSMDELREQAKGYIQMEEMSTFRNEVKQARQKCDKQEANTKTDLHKLNKIPIRLPSTKHPRLGLDTTKYCRYHRSIGHNTEYYWALNDKIKELIQAGYLA